jgi:hypothetical protein
LSRPSAWSSNFIAACAFSKNATSCFLLKIHHEIIHSKQVNSEKRGSGFLVVVLGHACISRSAGGALAA